MSAAALPFDPKFVTHIRRVLSVAECGKPDWNPSTIYIYADDNRFSPARKQITLSIGFTENGNLKKVLARYIAKGGKLGNYFSAYVPNIGVGPSLSTNAAFINNLKTAGSEPVMVEAQNECFDEFYLGPAFSWANQYAFTWPLSFLVIADSFLHSGSMLPFLMNSFPEKKPAAGGNEKRWITDYLNARKNWLANHSNKVLNKTVYRANCFMIECEKDNWSLEKSPIVMNGTPIYLA